jgi:hypothetical protein
VSDEDENDNNFGPRGTQALKPNLLQNQDSKFNMTGQQRHFPGILLTTYPRNGLTAQIYTADSMVLDSEASPMPYQNCRSNQGKSGSSLNQSFVSSRDKGLPMPPNNRSVVGNVIHQRKPFQL